MLYDLLTPELERFMLLFPIIILALVQGITEFLPISSSGHLILTHWLLDGDGASENYSQNHLMDIAVHIGTLCAVLLYFRKDVVKLFEGFFGFFTKGKTEKTKLTSAVIVASIPVIFAGIILHKLQPDFMNSLMVIAVANIVFAILLYVSDKVKVEAKTSEDVGFKEALFIGIMQALALIPGTSRSGVTMTAGRFLGLSRGEAARFSLLLAMVAIGGAGILGVYDVIQGEDAKFGMEVALATIISFITAYIAIILMMKWLEKATFTPFVIYRILFGIALIILIQTGMLG